MRRELIALVLVAAAWLSVPDTADAFTPYGWHYVMHPYLYSSDMGEWIYMSEDNTQWCCDMSSAQWDYFQNTSLSGGWVYFQWPYAYSSTSHHWFYFNEYDEQWCLLLARGAWGRLQQPASNIGDYVQARREYHVYSYPYSGNGYEPNLYFVPEGTDSTFVSYGASGFRTKISFTPGNTYICRFECTQGFSGVSAYTVHITTTLGATTIVGTLAYP